MKQYAVYTAIVGGYDSIQQPLVIDDRFDYIIFSDSIVDKQIGVWEVRHIDYYNDIQVKIARYVKTHSHTLLAEYKATLWVDASVLIKSNYLYQRVVELCDQNDVIATLVHPDRNCIYEEMFAVLSYRYEIEDVILRWGKFLRKDNYPSHNGLSETRILYRRNIDIVGKMNELWWGYIEKYSRRDQLSFNYVLSALQIPFVSLLPANTSIRDFEYFQIMHHANEASKFYAINADSWLIKYYRKHPDAKENIMKVYYRIYRTAYPKIWADFWGQVFRMRDFISRKMTVNI